MVSHTWTVQEVPIKFQNLLKQAGGAEHPVWLTTEKNTDPVAVLMKVDKYQQLQQREYHFYHWQLLYLEQWLERVEQQFDDLSLRKACIFAWQDNIESLWEIGPKSVKGLCASLILSTKLLDEARLSTEQILALRYCIQLLRHAEPSSTELDEAHQKLIESGIPPMVSLDKSTIQSYLDEL